MHRYCVGTPGQRRHGGEHDRQADTLAARTHGRSAVSAGHPSLRRRGARAIRSYR
jgi:hypothetical protein